MRKHGAYILLLIFIFNYTALDQVFKLPVLVTHYHEHQLRNGKISVMDFLCIHYWGQDINDNDEARDMQLPYKHVNLNTLQYSFIPLVKTIFVKLHVNNIAPRHYSALTVNYLQNPSLSSLFRPPKA